jgi:hypothetical protein
VCLALARLEARSLLVDDIDPALAAHDATALVAQLHGLQGIHDFHGRTRSYKGEGPRKQTSEKRAGNVGANRRPCQARPGEGHPRRLVRLGDGQIDWRGREDARIADGADQLVDLSGIREPIGLVASVASEAVGSRRSCERETVMLLSAIVNFKFHCEKFHTTMIDRPCGPRNNFGLTFY